MIAFLLGENFWCLMFRPNRLVLYWVCYMCSKVLGKTQIFHYDILEITNGK